MQKIIILITVLLISLTGCVNTRKIYNNQETPLEVKAVWFSYFDWSALPHEEEEFKIEVEQIVKKMKLLGLNTIYLHAHSHSDSYYKMATYFSLSKYASYTKYFSEDFDAFDYFIQEAHKENIKVHAWFNPYRVGNVDQFENVPENSLLSEWKTIDEEYDGRHFIFHRNAWYLNPSNQEIHAALVNSIRELCQNYEIDGIHFDDYFYPAIDDSNPELSFDKTDWENSGSEMELEEWRRNNVSKLVSEVYTAVHEEIPDGVFGISPAGNIKNLQSSQQYLVDINKWLNEEGYLDYIIPQIYWGFYPRLSNGNIAPWAFKNCLADWIKAAEKSTAKLYVGLALYRAGTDVKDGNEISEWLTDDDIIERQIECCKNEPRVTGFSLFDWKQIDNFNGAN